MKTMIKVFFVLVINCAFFLNLNAQDSQDELYVEQLSEDEAFDIKGSDDCNPGDIIIIVKSNIPDLNFDSNLIDLNFISYDAELREYSFCHRKESFWLTIFSPKYMAKEVYINAETTKYAFRVVAKIPTGKIQFNTNPKNALVDFGLSGQSPHLTGVPIEQNAGSYNVRISKFGYLPIDTTVIVPSNGSTNYIDVSLIEDFAKIQLDITSADKNHFQIYPVIDIDTAHINLADLYDRTKIKSFDDAGSLEYFKLYSGGYIPVPPGNYNVVINTPGFQTYSTRIIASKSSTSPLTAKLQPITGYLTIIDNGNAMGARVFLDEELIGEVPIFKYKIRIGNHKLRFEKEGFMTSEEEYRISVENDSDEDFLVSMNIFRKYTVISDPVGAEILIDEQRKGFTPYDIYLKEGNHELIVRRTGFLDYKQNFVINESTDTSEDTIHIVLETNHPMDIKSEQVGLNILIKRGKEIVSKGKTTPAEIQLPYGKYHLGLFDMNNKERFSGTFNHDGEKNVYAPSYSRGTFTTIVGDLFLSPPKAMSQNENNYYNLFANAQFGRFNLFPGLSTSILRTSVFTLNKEMEGKKIVLSDEAEVEIKDKYMFAASCLFLNGEFRMGGSIFRFLDVSALGSFVWYPEIHNLFSPLINYVSGTEMFLGIEVSTRISYFNVNIKLGKEVYKGNYNFLTEKSDSQANSKDIYSPYPFKADNMVLTLGFTLGRSVSSGNNMLRLWKKPFITSY